MAISARALTTLDAVKTELDITDSSSDDKLERWINAGSDFVEKYTGRKFKKETKQYEVSGSGTQYLILRERPILSINEVLIGEQEITNFTVDENDFERGLLFRDLGWGKTQYNAGLTGDPIGERRTYTVDYTYGYVLPQDDGAPDDRTLPYDLEQIVIDLVANKFQMNNLESWGLSMIKQGRITYRFTEGDLDFIQKTTLNQYRKLSF